MREEDKKAVGIIGGALLGAAGVGAYAYYKAKNALPSNLGDIKEGFEETVGGVKEKAKDVYEDLKETFTGGVQTTKAASQVVSSVFDTVGLAGLNPSSLYIPGAAIASGPLVTYLADKSLKEGLNAGMQTGQYLVKVINNAGESVYVLSEAALSESAIAQFKQLSAGVYGLATAVGWINNSENPPNPSQPDPQSPAQPDPQVPINEQPTGGTLLEQLQYDFPIEKVTRRSVKYKGEWLTIDILNVTAKNFLAGANSKNVKQWMKQASGLDWSIVSYSYYWSDMRVVAAYLDQDHKIRYTLITDYMSLINPEGYDYAEVLRQVPSETFVLFRPKLFNLKINNGKTYIKSAQPTFYRALVSLITTGRYTVPTLLDLTMRENGDIPAVEHMAFTGSLTSK